MCTIGATSGTPRSVSACNQARTVESVTGTKRSSSGILQPPCSKGLLSVPLHFPDLWPTFALLSRSVFLPGVPCCLLLQNPKLLAEAGLQELKGFRRTHIAAGQTVAVIIPLVADDLRIWERCLETVDVGAGELRIAAASDDIRSTAVVAVQPSCQQRVALRSRAERRHIAFGTPRRRSSIPKATKIQKAPKEIRYSHSTNLITWCHGVGAWSKVDHPLFEQSFVRHVVRHTSYRLRSFPRYTSRSWDSPCRDQKPEKEHDESS